MMISYIEKHDLWLLMPLAAEKTTPRSVKIYRDIKKAVCVTELSLKSELGDHLPISPST